jgi:hypothetical protein
MKSQNKKDNVMDCAVQKKTEKNPTIAASAPLIPHISWRYNLSAKLGDHGFDVTVHVGFESLGVQPFSVETGRFFARYQ